MKPVTVVTGRAVPLDRSDVDTDQIIPSDWLKRVERTGFGAGLFSEWRDDRNFVLNQPQFVGANILVAGPNFGTGSSREHAVWALLDYGFEAVVSPRFADIFRNNCTKQGLLPVEVEAGVGRALLDAVIADPSLELTIDVARGTVEAPASGTDWFVPSRPLHPGAPAQRVGRHRADAAPRGRDLGLRAPPLPVDAHLGREDSSAVTLGLSQLGREHSSALDEPPTSRTTDAPRPPDGARERHATRLVLIGGSVLAPQPSAPVPAHPRSFGDATGITSGRRRSLPGAGRRGRERSRRFPRSTDGRGGTMLKDFKAFIMRGNVVDLAVAVVIGAAFGAVVTALVNYLITPLVSIPGKANFANLSFSINHSIFYYGKFLNALIAFVLLAAAVFFFVIKPINSLSERRKRGQEAEPGTRDCPECLSEIPDRARRCAHCTAEVQPTA